ncbi:efflux RND transporter periplasmic adaptor subunit [Tabrizicola sp. J26]|uniref:efflux RND transporter periplasmic adaptor subunit n=1 Tax=Alitabrizicola rongguiensis TaxID=2909234 RepID=UPI001F199002|nr:efflux RND transporter periplasmic adaptor subunit [Tabrizicola rongguiensis]MCF1709540.1 efflux RND transporter periplasmic adaptor subunit [Tabrizicola rongguiensis]
MSEDKPGIDRLLADGRRKRRRWFWLGVPVAALLLAGGWYLAGGLGGNSAVSYVTEPVIRGPLSVTVTATGTIEPITQVEVSSELSGTITAVEVNYNDRVEVGQVLARLDDTKLKAEVDTAEATLLAAEATVERSQATLDEAEENLRSITALDLRGVTKRLDLVANQATRNRAKADLAIGQADRKTAEAKLAMMRADLEKSVIRSPIKGVVLSRAAEPGQIVASSLSAPTLFTLAEDLSRMELRVDVDEADIGQVAEGNAATFTVDAFPGRSFPAVITQVRFAPETTDGVVTYKAILSVDNAELLLRPGMTATAVITVKEVPDAMLVPNAALRFSPPETAASSSGSSGNGLLGLIIPRPPSGSGSRTSGEGAAVWVLRDGAPVRVPITKGDSDGRLTAVSAEGLKDGDLVIVDSREGA